MENLYTRIFNSLPSKNEIKKTISHFSKREYFVFWGLVIILCLSTLAILQKINRSLIVDIPTQGGSITEGIVGSPRFINPALARTNTEQDLVSLVYSGLMRKNSDGNFIPDLAEKYEVSKDALTYTFTLKDKIYFHDGKPVTAEDIIFTINQIKDPIIKSPKKVNWDGVSVEKVDEKTVKFVLKQPFALFLENTTVGIMPSHIWDGSPIELNDANTNPVGSGPYEVSKVSKQSSGIIDFYDLKYFKKFILGRPYIANLTLRFYLNEDDLISALETGEVDQVSFITPERADKLKEEGYKIESSALPRVFGLFFNQNQNQIFTDKNIANAINLAIDKKEIISKVLQGYGVVIDNPIPPNIIAYETLGKENNLSLEEKKWKAEEILKKGGWEKGPSGFLEKSVTKNKKKTSTVLEFSISTGNTPDLTKSAELIRENLQSMGMKVDIKTFETGNLNQLVIRPRKYDVLLFGQAVDRESALYSFWHSSQRNDPGLNVAMYTNTKVDKILEDAFITVDRQSRIKKYIQLEEEIRKDMPAVFLYSPDFIYIVSKELKGFSMDHIISSPDRFSNSYLWYTKTDSIWKIFSK